jgi:hypothetical protein
MENVPGMISGILVINSLILVLALLLTDQLRHLRNAGKETVSTSFLIIGGKKGCGKKKTLRRGSGLNVSIR